MKALVIVIVITGLGYMMLGNGSDCVSNRSNVINSAIEGV